MVGSGRLMKVLHGDGIILEGKKGKRGHYYLTENLMRGGASRVRQSPERSGAPGGGGSSMRSKIRKDER